MILIGLFKFKTLLTISWFLYFVVLPDFRRKQIRSIQTLLIRWAVMLFMIMYD